MTTNNDSRADTAHQLRLLPAADQPRPAPAGAHAAAGPADPAPSSRAAQLSLISADALPTQLRIDARTRRVGRAGIAELRRILAGPGQAA